MSSNGRDWWPVCAGCIPDGWPRGARIAPARALEQSVGGLRKMQQDLLSKNHQWSEAFKQQKALQQELEQRIARFVQAVNGQRFLTPRGALDAIAEHLRPQQAQA